MKEYSIYEFWNKLPGPGEFSSDDFAAIPMAATVWGVWVRFLFLYSTRVKPKVM